MALHEGIIPYNNNSGSPLRFVPISNMSEGAAIVIATIQTKYPITPNVK